MSMRTWLARTALVLALSSASALAPKPTGACSLIRYEAESGADEDLGVWPTSAAAPTVMAVEWHTGGARSSGCIDDELSCGGTTLTLTVEAASFRYARLERADGEAIYLRDPDRNSSEGIIARRVVLGPFEGEWLGHEGGEFSLSLVAASGVRSESVTVQVPPAHAE